MKTTKYLAGVAVIGLASAMASAPALADEGDGTALEVSLEAQGNFEGFRMPRAAISATSLDDEALRVSKTIEGTLVPPNPKLIVRDDIGTGGAVDVNNTIPSAVQLFSQRNSDGGVFFNCTGTLINPRTVITAAHCLNARSSEAYGTVDSGAERTVLVATGVNTRPRLITYLNTGAGYADGGVASSTDVIIHSSANVAEGGLPFPSADIAFVALDAPITDTPTLPLLLTPLDKLTHVLVVGYGTTGTGETGSQGIGFLRRVGENMLGAVASSADFLDAVFPGAAPTRDLGFETQSYYYIDFDDPNRSNDTNDGCTFTPGGFSCDTFEDVRALNWFGDNALPQEAGTAPGDSGSALIADELTSIPLIIGVLSGGWDFGLGTNNGYGDVSFYNPLYPFFEFITENTPYKYVSAKAGNGVWSDASRWTQDLDPGFFIQTANGDIVNGVPGGDEAGVYETGPNIGTILGIDISDFSDEQAPFLPPRGTPGFGENIPESSVLLGPGSTGFVPNNTDGTPGTAFENPALYFDVLLTRAGTTTVDMDVEIDRLTIDGNNTGFVLPEEYDFTSLIGVEQYGGFAAIDGQLNAGNVLVFGGTFGGNGTVSTDAFFNVSGTVAPGGVDTIGTLTIDGDYVQTSEGSLLVDAKRTGGDTLTFDQLVVTGDASLAGELLVKPTGKITAKFGAEWTVLTANSVLGNFDTVSLLTRSPVLYAGTRVEGGDVIVEIGANPIAQIVGEQSDLSSLAAVLDTLRFSGRYADFAGIFGVVDTAGFDIFGQTLAGLTPTSGFQQTFSANSFAQRFTGQVAQRTLRLRGADGAASGFSAAGSASFAQAGTAPGTKGKLGFFASVSGSYLTMAQGNRNTGNDAVREAAFSEAGELTLGADYKVSDDLVVGVAMSSVRDGANAFGALSPMENESTSGAIYAAKTFGKGFADAYFGFADQRHSAARGSTGNAIGAFDRASGTAKGSQSFAGVRLGYAMEPAQDLTLGPVASIDYVRSDLGGYREYGAGQFGLNVDSRSFTSIGAKLGAMASLDMKVGQTGVIKAFGSVAYARELGDSQDVVTASFVGAADLPFSIARQLDTQWVAVNAGAEMALSNRISTKLSLTSDIGRGDLTNNQANMTLNWRF